MTYRTAAGQFVSVTRLDFLLSAVALHRADGVWLQKRNWFAYLGLRDGRTNFTLSQIPAGIYDRIRFHIGLEPSVNHGNVAQWPANHPLNPDVNHLYWGWSKEYVFLAFEGRWQNGNQASGFSYHLATDRELMSVELPLELNLHHDQEVHLTLAADKILSTPNEIRLNDNTDTSHSRTNDTLAVQLKENVEAAFSVDDVRRFSPVAGLAHDTNHIEMAPDATPYRLTISRLAPQPQLPRDNPLTVEGVALGKKLFFDRRLSVNNSESCATCHDPDHAFSQPQRFSTGVDGKSGTRNAMSLENLAWKNSFFWDGRAATLRQQVLEPIQNPIEMHEPLTNLVTKISADTNYARRFDQAFGSPIVSADKIARALEQFLLTRVSFDSKFDQVMAGTASFTGEEARGFILFNTEYDPYHGQHGADCFHCHGGPLFQSQAFANNGLDASFKDPGRYAVTHRKGDQGKFAVPSLRNVAVTAPYMHDGRFKTLPEAVAHYCTGMKRSPTLDPNLAKHPDGGVPLSASDQKAIVAFLKTLTDSCHAQSSPGLTRQ